MRRAAVWLRRVPLRLKLVAALLALVLVALVVSGVLAITTMRSYLAGRTDDQLRAVAAQGVSGLTRDAPDGSQHPPDPDGDHSHDPSRLPSAYVLEVTNATGAVVDAPTDNLTDPDQPLPRLPQVSGNQAKADGTRFTTVDATSGSEQWRVLVTPVTLQDGSPGALLVAQSLGDVDGTVDHLTLLLTIIGAATIAVIGAVGYVTVRASLRPLRAVERTAADIAAGDLSHRVPQADPRTEIGHLAASLNTMLTEIESAFAARAASEAAARGSEDRMRRFVADASHELRTPLTTIRGFAELYRQGAVGDAAELRRLMGRIEDEAKRMGLLVEDLLLLARLDEERPLARERVDMLALAGDAVHDARALAPTRQITLDVGATDPPPVVIGDEPRLRQVLTNLLSNALRYTPDGTPITVALESSSGMVTIAVADRGPGLTPDVAARVFERFYRADAARSRAQGGTGLGLAIVAALVAGHGGRVDVQTAPGAGATFRVTLPLADPG